MARIIDGVIEKEWLLNERQRQRQGNGHDLIALFIVLIIPIR